VQPENIVRGIQVSDFPDDHLTIRGIFLHRHNWDNYALAHRGTVRAVEVAEVGKMLRCHERERGFAWYVCPSCGESSTVTFGCNSRLCSGCGKPHADRWAASLRKSILPLPHRHLTFTLPAEARPLLRRHRELLMKAMMDATILTLDEALDETIHGRPGKRCGAIAVLHPFGRDLEFKPHVHVICLEGAFDGKRFVQKTFFPMGLFRKTWQYHVLTRFRNALKQTDREGLQTVEAMFRDHPDGFYVHVTKETRIENPDKVIRYVGRYVRHPAIAESRLVGYDGTNVTFQWTEHDAGALRSRTLPVDAFIEALIQHVPERHFKMIRYYGVYSRSLKEFFRTLAEQWSMTQSKITGFPRPKATARVVKCPGCGTAMDLVWYVPPSGAEEADFGSKVEDWNHVRPSRA